MSSIELFLLFFTFIRIQPNNSRKVFYLLNRQTFIFQLKSKFVLMQSISSWSVCSFKNEIEFASTEHRHRGLEDVHHSARHQVCVPRGTGGYHQPGKHYNLHDESICDAKLSSANLMKISVTSYNNWYNYHKLESYKICTIDHYQNKILKEIFNSLLEHKFTSSYNLHR